MKCYRALDRTRTWVLVLLSVLVPPLIVFGVQRSNYLQEVQTLQQRYERIQTAAQPKRKDVVPEMLALEDKHNLPEKANDLVGILNAVYGRTAYTAAAPSAQPFTRCIAPALMPFVQQYAELGTDGIAQLETWKLDSSGNPPRFPNYKVLYALGAAAEVLSMAAFQEGQTTEGLQRLQMVSKLAALMPWYLPGSRYTVAMQILRVQGDEADSHLLANAVPARWNIPVPHQTLVDVSMANSTFLKRWGYERIVFVQAAQQLSEEQAVMTNPANRHWADWWKGTRSGPAWYPFPTWTHLPVLERKLEKIASTELDLTWRRMGNPELFSGVSALSAAYYARSQAQHAESHLRKPLTERAVFLLACAAYHFRRQHDRWPDSLDELSHAYRQQLPPIDSSAGDQRSHDLLEKMNSAYGPVELLHWEITPANIIRYLGLEYPSAQALTWTATERDNPTTGAKSFYITGQPWSQSAFAAWLSMELLRQHPHATITSVTLSYAGANGKRQEIASAAEAFFLSTQATNWPGDYAACRDQALAELAGGSEAVKQIADKHAPPIALNQLEVRARVEVCERALAIRSYGRDGLPEPARPRPDEKDIAFFLY